MRKLFVCVVAISLLAGCATGYQPKGFKGGFTETQLAPDSWRVSFGGNAFTSPEAAVDYTLLRCAELTLQGGYTHFVVISGENRRNVSTSTTPMYANTVGNRTTITGGDTVSISKPTTTNVIVMLNGSPAGTRAFDAAFLTASLKKKYGL